MDDISKFLDGKEYIDVFNYEFKNPELLREALTHSSFGWVDEDEVRIDNEKLEFIGDGFLDAIVGTEIYNRMPKEAKEGDLTKMRAQIVCEKTLSVIGRKLKLGEHLQLGIGEEKTGGREKNSLIADAVEAVIGAIYLDGGYDAAKTFVKAMFDNTIEEALSGRLIADYKTEIQERAQRLGKTVKYIIDRTEGTDHDKTFYLHVEIDGEIVGHGVGKSKKEAQQNAAREIIEKGVENVL